MKEHLKELIAEALRVLKADKELAEEFLKYEINLERTRDKKHGHYASNIALKIAKSAGKQPRVLAEKVIKAMPESEHVEKVQVAGPGFINFYIKDETISAFIPEILKQKKQYGLCNHGDGKLVHIEFVSANPTGPLHVGHGRGAAYGAATANLLQAVGYKVHREYYINDAGRQMNILTVSMWLRYLEELGETFVFPKNAYRGAYVIDIAKELVKTNQKQFFKSADDAFKNVPKDEGENSGDKEAHIDGLIENAKRLLGKDYEIVFNFGKDKILTDIKNDLEEFGVVFDEWFSEKSLITSGAIKKGIEALKRGDYVYTKAGAQWFRSTKFGDEKDRVLVREDGRTTYFASDVAYHWNKINRGYQEIIDVLGADHHGYVTRVKASMEALGLSESQIKIPLVQFAVLYRNGEKVQMSTRSGEFVTLRELRQEVGNDAARFFYIMRKSEQHMDFDLDLAKSKTNENPVYYIQYAHARICSVFRQLKEKQLVFDKILGLKSLDKLTESHEKSLVTLLGKYKELLINAADKLEPHRVAHYLRKLATAFHAYYNAHQFLVEDKAIRDSRLCLIKATQYIIQSGLTLLGVQAPEEM